LRINISDEFFGGKEMKITDIPVSKLKPFDGNVRKHSEKQVNEMIRALEQFGQTRAIVCDENGMVLVGNCLLEAVKRLGWETVQCYQIKGMSSAKKKKLVLSDNQIFKMGADDFDAIRNLVADISIEEDLDIAGYDTDILELMIADDDFMEAELQSQGTITDEKLTTYTPPTPKAGESVSANQEQETREDISGHTEAQHETVSVDTRKTIICPSCGEMIYID
jgi:ParB-like chromosome segregation protein Spo0J